MNVQKKTLLFGTLLTGGIVGLMYAFSKLKNQKNPIRRARHVPKEVIIRVLKEIDNEMFSVLSNIAMVANQLKQQARGRLPNEEIRDFLLNHTPQTKEQIKNVSETVCHKHGLEEIELRYACEVTFQNDIDIQALLSEAKAIFDKAFIGIPPEVKTDVPDFLTAELTLNLMKTIMKESLFKVQDFLADLKKKGVRISTENPQVLMGLQNLKIDDIRKKILNDKGLNKYREPALKIFQYAIQKYTQQNPDNFSQKMLKLEMQNQRAMKALMNGATDAFTMIDAIGAHLAQSPEDLISSHLKNKRLHKTAASQNQGARRKSREDEETAKALNEIKNLQNQISFQLKNNLEDSQFPQELVQSAVDTLFNVFDNMKKDLSPSEAKQNEAIKAQSQQTIVVVENPEVNREEAKAIATEPSEVEIKEARGAEGAYQVEEKAVIATEDAQTQEAKVQETVTEENPEASN